MVAVIETDGLTKFYGRSRGIWLVDLEVNEGEVFGFLGAERGGQDDHDPHPPELLATHRRAGMDLRDGHPAGERAHPGAGR
jgi:hypothetical protein